MIKFIFYICIVVVLILTIGFNARTFRCFCKSGFVKTIGSIMGILLATIFFFCGLFSDTLIQHEEKHASDNLFWFRPKNIVEFPIEELKHTMQEEQDTIKQVLIADTIDIQCISESVHYIFVVDKTLDSEKPPDNKIEDLRKLLKQRIGENDSSWLGTKYFIDREDLMLAGCIHKILNENKENTYQVFVYNGEYKNPIPNDPNEFLVINTVEFSDFLKTYSYLEREDRRPRNTNFKRIADTITNSLKASPILKDKKKVITIFSDLVHEEKTGNFKTVDKAIHELSILSDISVSRKDMIYNKHVKTVLNLVVLEHKNKFNTAYNVNTRPYSWHESSFNNLHGYNNCQVTCDSTCMTRIDVVLPTRNNVENHTYITIQSQDTIDKDAMHYRIKDLFLKYFHFCHRYNYREADLFTEDYNTLYNYLANIVTFPHIDKRTDDRTLITFRYPFMSGKFNELGSTYLKFKQEGDYFMSINDNSVAHCDFVMRLIPIQQITNEEIIILKKGDTKKFNIDTSIVYMAEFDADKLSKNMEWCFSYIDKSENKIIKESIPIKFVTKIPKTLSYILILMIMVFAILTVSLVFYFSFKLAICGSAYNIFNLSCNLFCLKKWDNNKTCIFLKRFFSVLTILIAGWLFAKVINVIYYHFESLRNIEKNVYIPNLPNRIDYFSTLYITIVVIILIILTISIWHESRYKIKLHKMRLYNKLNCAYQPLNNNVETPPKE